jgi:hypothetical protein
VSAKVEQLLADLYAEFGWKSRLAAAASGGRYVLWKPPQEQRRLNCGPTYEPPTFFEVNEPMSRLPEFPFPQARSVICCPSSFRLYQLESGYRIRSGSSANPLAG